MINQHFTTCFRSYNTSPKTCKDIIFSTFAFFYREENRFFCRSFTIQIAIHREFNRSMISSYTFRTENNLSTFFYIKTFTFRNSVMF